jgi:hypothetical protein
MSGNQRFVCGMRRFDKHRMESHTSSRSPSLQTDIQDRLKAREQQDLYLFSSSTPSDSPSTLSLIPPPNPSPVLSTVTTTYTSWKTPAAPSR